MGQIADLEGLAADGGRDEAGSAHLVEIGKHVVNRRPGGGIDAGLLGDFLVVVDHAVEMERHGNLDELAIDRGEIANDRGEVFGDARRIVELGQIERQATFRQVAIDAGIGLNEGVGRIAAGHHVDQADIDARIVRNGEILPGDALLRRAHLRNAVSAATSAGVDQP